MRAGGLECDRQGFGFDGAIDDAGRLQIFGEEVVPGVHLFGVDQQNGARDLPALAKSSCGALRDIDDGNVTVRRKRWSPGDGDGAQHELLGRNHGHSRRAFRPRCLDGEIFGMNAVRACGLERRNAPFDRLLHGWRARNATANLVGQLLQIGFERRGLLGLGDHAIG